MEVCEDTGWSHLEQGNGGCPDDDSSFSRAFYEQNNPSPVFGMLPNCGPSCVDSGNWGWEMFVAVEDFGGIPFTLHAGAGSNNIGNGVEAGTGNLQVSANGVVTITTFSFSELDNGCELGFKNGGNLKWGGE